MNIPYLSLQRVTALHSEEIRKAVDEVVVKGWYLQGEEVAAFEKEYADYCHQQYCVTTANGLDALTIMLRACKELGRLHDGDEVIVPANTYIATILAITENSLTPVLVEPSPLLPEGGILKGAGSLPFQIDENRIEVAITSRTRAIMLVNLYGYNAYTEKIGRICREHNLQLFIDNAQGHGIGRPSASFPQMGLGAVAHSFYPGKNLGALGDAGAVTTDDAELATAIRTLANYGSSRKYVFDYQGRNSRMDEIQAAALRVKLRYLGHDNQRRRDIARRYCSEIHHELIKLPPYSDQAVYHIYPILTEERDRLQQYLRDNGIGTMIHYPIPPHKQQAYQEWNDRHYPITERIHREELSLPLNQAMTDEEAEYVIKIINSWK